MMLIAAAAAGASLSCCADQMFLSSLAQFCITDVLEVLLQKRMQRADMACAIDYNWDPPRFCAIDPLSSALTVSDDQWVTRTMDGFTLYGASPT